MFKSLREKLASWKSRLVQDAKPEAGKNGGGGREGAEAKAHPDGSGSAQAKADPEKDGIYSDSFFAHRVKEDKLDELMWELEVSLMESDVAVPVIEEIKGELKKSIAGRKVRRDVSIEEAVELALRDSVNKALTIGTESFDRFIEKTGKPIVILFVGINGTGKTTTIAKIANRLMKNGTTCVMAAGDTFRAGAIEQLERHSEKLGIRLIKHKAGADSAAVAFDAIEHAKARHRDVVLIDTAGRMQTNQNLMDEMKKMKRVAKPHMVVFVGDALAGNDAVEQAKTFDEGVGIDAVILNKIDADAKGGAALSIAHTVKKPILFVGTGQGYDDLVEFSPEWMTNRLFSNA
jgi:fused signal recognition particle receptor